MTSIGFEQVDSFSELQERLRRSPHAVLLGKDNEAHREYFLGTMSSCTIGICSQGHGPRPGNVLDEQNSRVWIGYNSSIANVALGACRKRFILALDGVFYTILSCVGDGSVIVIHELGACRVGGSGRLMWKCATQVVTEFSDAGDVVRLLTDEGETRIDKDTGALL